MPRTEAGPDRWFPLRAALSVCLLAWLIAKVDLGDLAKALDHAQVGWVAAAIAAFLAAQVFGALRWKAIVNSLAAVPRGIDTSFALIVTFSALWYSNFLPSAFGGDAVRIAQTWARGGRMLRAVTASLLDRYFGLAGLLLVLLACLPLVDGHAELRGPLLAVTAIFFLGPLAVVRVGGPQLCGRRFARTLARLVAAVRRVVRDRVAMQRQFAFTALATLAGFAAYWFSALAAGVWLSPAMVVVVASLAVLASALPISLAGWGVREGALISLLEAMCGLSPAEATLVALINASTIVAGSLIGGGIQLRCVPRSP